MRFLQKNYVHSPNMRYWSVLVGNKSVLLEFGSGSQDIHHARKQETRVPFINVLV